ncbi:BglG family transcriptional antiterminator /transcriptional regulator [Dielma fastidiosa]|uniref:BglG family transcriptional antiterminator /transcriptional regulator n=2 Tax=Dielma fastidiosa TaxID=1034346 RepID=A0A318KZ12_9FIRM|nr:BglG family transcriptional antiterminator /transcriptional regulator [Dielma fastidiosa]
MGENKTGDTMNKNQKIIMKELLASDVPLTSEHLALTCGVSSKSIRRYLADLKDQCEQHGATIIMKPGLGNLIRIDDEEKFHTFLEKERSSQKIPNSPEERLDYLLNLLLYNSDYVKVSDIADDLFISTSRLSIDLKNLRSLLDNYHLKIVNKPNYGIKIQGNERDRRICMAEYYMKKRNDDTTSNPNDAYQVMINNVITKVLVQKNIHMSDIALQSLAIHLLIAVERIKTSNIIQLTSETQQKMEAKGEYSIALALKDAIEHTFGITLPISEICYLTQHLIGKKHFESDTNEFDVEVNEEVTILVNVILRSIFDQTRMDFYNDIDLKMNLMLHMIPFLERVRNQMMVHNPIINDIKEKYSFAYELASIGLSAVCERLKVKITEDEISFFALHFILALERKREEVAPSNILIVCSTGRATSQLLAYQIQKKFGDRINVIRIIEAHRLDQMNLESFDFIFSTVPIHKEYPLPIRQINNLLEEKDFNLIESCLKAGTAKLHIRDLMDEKLFFTDIDAQNKEEALQILIQKVSDHVSIPDNFYQLVLEREEFASTELNNLVAIPHPNCAVTNSTFIATGILKKPIIWNSKSVQIIFLIAIMPNNKQDLRDFYEGVVDFVTKEKNTTELLHKQTYDNLMNLLEHTK